MDSKYISIEEFRQYFSLSYRQVKGMIDRGDIKAVKLGRFYRILRSEINRLENTPASKEEEKP
jgi:excisionase family DNA binding protein